MSLESFFLSYLGTDFDLIDGTPAAGIEAFARNQPADEVRAARDELVALLASTRGHDERLLDAVYALGCGVVADGPEMRVLLQQAADRWQQPSGHGEVR